MKKIQTLMLGIKWAFGKCGYNLVLIFLLSGLIEISFAQIPNASFESWTGGKPDNWKAVNVTGYNFITQVNNAHAGSSAVKSVVLNMNGYNMQSPLSLGSDGNGANTGIAPLTIHGWYMFNSVGGDYINVTVLMVNSATSFPTGSGLLSITETGSVYKEFVVDLNYSGNEGEPSGDKLQLVFSISPTYPSDIHVGTYYILDDLSFGTSSGINDPLHPDQMSLEQNQPNPAIEQTTIIYSLSSASLATLEIYDLMGRKIKTVVNEYQSPGRYKAVADVSDLAPGNYFYRLNSEGNSITKMLTIVK